MEELLKEIQTTIRQVDPNLPVLKTQSLQSHLETSVDTWVMRTGAVLFGSLGVSALLLALLGVYGVKAYSVARRTREIGIRMALGSTTREVVFLFLRDGMRLTVVSLVIGGALAVGVSLAMGSILFDVNRFDPLVFITAPLFLAIASLAATWLPARRAAKVDPLIALRSE
jgi:ABC-type antimicrobial peptide transport system permease subunit